MHALLLTLFIEVWASCIYSIYCIQVAPYCVELFGGQHLWSGWVRECLLYESYHLTRQIDVDDIFLCNYQFVFNGIFLRNRAVRYLSEFPLVLIYHTSLY